MSPAALSSFLSPRSLRSVPSALEERNFPADPFLFLSPGIFYSLASVESVVGEARKVGDVAA